MKQNDLIKVRVNGQLEEIPRKWYETAQIFNGIDRQVLSCLDENLQTEKALQRLDAIYKDNAEHFGPVGWEGYVTRITYEKVERCKAIDDHLRYEFE